MSARAEERGTRVLRADAAWPERDFPLGAVRQLFEPVPAEPRIPYDPESPEEPVPLPVLRQLRAQAEELAAAEPLLIAVDDLHWADEGSLRRLAYVAKRPPHALGRHRRGHPRRRRPPG
ncbi:hypothetical protein [Streptomyces sp. NPDC052496]|uniref:hypothetical protein n=1 Tax=Streptomyces sp. NPDC052496 TaxID=3154951 RepID=UPI003445A84E